ncbi:MAG: histidine phosphatase family protein [Calditrichaceae bacterium]|nr:histidine phosphatase family protein [Calditrichaceae bacterium]MBN2710231.1 histidine phosphatase family protein [Calditrichaceae bacterium]RQV96604.1 MAG: hypothetical protein EH224_04040 [Calditrichota bacterium]
MKKLYLIRHAKSDWSIPGLNDMDRPLNNRGNKDAPLMARWLKSEDIYPDLIVSSPAHRALSTARIFAEILKYPEHNIRTDLLIYGGSGAEMLEIIRKTNDKLHTVFLFGHNPEITGLAEDLTGKTMESMSTCAILGIEFPRIESWRDVKNRSGVKVLYKYPRMFK